jgi:hypothetical protein
MGEVSETTTTTMTTTTKRKKKGRPSLLDLQKRSIKQQQKQHPHLDPPHSNNDDDVDERKLKKQKLLIGLNSHLQNPTTLLPNSNHTGSHQNVVVFVSTPFHSLYSSIQLLSNSHKPFQFSTISISLSQLHNCVVTYQLFFQIQTLLQFQFQNSIRFIILFFFTLISGISRVNIIFLILIS